MNRAASIVVALMAILLIGAPAAAAQRPLVLEFEKQWVAPDYYVGTVDGLGTIEMWLFDKSMIGNTQHFSANVAVAYPGRDFTALVGGQINLSTGRVVLNGSVTSGWMAGARVREESQLVDPDIGSFTGSIRLMPVHDAANNWHIHDGRDEPGHAPIGFFPAVLGLTTEQYLLDPAACPNATDKVLLGPDGVDAHQVVRAGVCRTSSVVIQLRTQDASRPPPTGWTLGSTADGLNTYVKLTALP